MEAPILSHHQSEAMRKNILGYFLRLRLKVSLHTKISDKIKELKIKSKFTILIQIYILSF